MRQRETASYWREKLIAIVIQLHVLVKNVLVAETSYQMLDVLLFCDRERAKASSLKIIVH